MPTPQENKIIQEVKSQMDPSSLTTQQLWREIASLKELLETRIESIEKAVQVAHTDLVRFPTEVQNQVANLKELHEKWFLEKFDGAQKYFIERDIRVEQTSKEAKVCFNEALAEKEKASGKQETYLTKQIDQLNLSINQNEKTVDDKINDLKDRLGKIEGIAIGALNTKVSQQTAGSGTVNILGLIIGTLIAIAGIIIGVMRSG